MNKMATATPVLTPLRGYYNTMYTVGAFPGRVINDGGRGDVFRVTKFGWLKVILLYSLPVVLTMYVLGKLCICLF